MAKLNLEMFTSIAEDTEAKQYRILAGLQQSRQQFQNNRLYPELSELINLHQTLINLRDSLDQFDKDFPKEIKEIDIENKEIIYGQLDLNQDQIKPVRDLINWAEPKLKEIIDDGVAIFEYVNERMEVENVGIIPNYQDEGYFFVPDNLLRELKLFQYEMSLFTSTEQRYRSLKTSYLESISTTFLDKDPATVKLNLLDQRKKLPNPATYSFHTELDFPFKETIFPVAKRKLMQRLYKAS